ncbi:MAG: YidC/Oxa1 family membrane protein insertase [Clostridia bacterium]|nr:YidC/Oxa1 family membrane protein insertase [Clostridia bacterium]
MWKALIGFLAKILEFLYNNVAFENWGIAVIEFTVLIKLILFPLTYKQLDYQKKIQQLQPELEKIQKKYKNDKDKLGQKTMELYQKNNVSPLGGCLPMLIQLPIIFALFYVVREIDFGGQGFLWIKNMGLPDAYVTKDMAGNPLTPYFNGYYILPVLAGVSQFLSTKMMMSQNEAAADNKMMTYFFPIFSAYICIKFPAGLSLYWFASNLFQMIQQYFMSPAKKPMNEGAK